MEYKIIYGGNLLHFLKKSEHSTHLFDFSNVGNSLCVRSSGAEFHTPKKDQWC